jgi:hypothetical protein
VPSHRAPNYVVGVHAICAADDNGLNPAAITSDNVDDWLARANEVFEVAGIRFTYNKKLELMKDSMVNGVEGSDDPNWEQVKAKLNPEATATGKVVIVFRQRGGGGFSSSGYDFVVMPGFNTDVDCPTGKIQNIGLLAHEIGHYLGLGHAFMEFHSVDEARNYFLSKGRNAQIFDADAGTISDTPPYPYIQELQCEETINTVELLGVGFSLGRENIMNYYYSSNPSTLSQQQILKVRETLLGRQIRHNLKIEYELSPSTEEFVFNAPYEVYRTKYDALWGQGWRLHLLDVTSVRDTALYNAVWRPGKATERQEYGSTQQSLRTTYGKLWPKGWRLHILDTYVALNEARYVAVWRSSSDSEIQIYDWSLADFRQEDTQQRAQGMRLHSVDTYVLGGQVFYAVVWKPGNEEEKQSYGLLFPSLFAKNLEWQQKGWRLHILDSYVLNGLPYFNAVWRRGLHEEMPLCNVPDTEFTSKYNKYFNLGWRIHILDTYAQNNSITFNTVWRK